MTIPPITCPRCRHRYTFSQCGIPGRIGVQATVFCECGYIFEVALITKRTWATLYLWRRPALSCCRRG